MPTSGAGPFRLLKRVDPHGGEVGQATEGGTTMTMTAQPALSADRMRRMHDVFARHIDAGYAPGIVTAVARGDETHVDVIGDQSLGGAPMRPDTIFRITAMTKPLVAT